MRFRTLAPIALLLGAASLVSCDGAPSTGEPTPSVSFRYSGARTGRFSVTAPRPPAAGPWSASYVKGVATGSDAFSVSSFAISGEVADAVIIEGPSAPGTYAIGPCATEAVCASVSGAFDAAVGNTPREGERGFYLTQGTLTIDRPLREGRVRGRFSGSAALSVYAFGTWQRDGVAAITEGTFEADLAAGPHP